MTKSMTPKNMLKSLAAFALLGLLSAPVLASEDGVALQSAGTDLTDKGSLQRGAKYFLSYCAGCHSLKHLRYSRIGDDLGLSEQEVMDQLNVTGVKNVGEPIIASMTPEMAKAAFNKEPPDLSLIARVRGSDWIYTYLKTFYLDPTRPVGWNNTTFPGASMPNPLWSLQGTQQPEYTDKVASGEKDEKGQAIMACPHGTTDTDQGCIKRLVVSQAGTMKPEQFDQVARDITTFLEYAGEPAGLKRPQIGVWVLAFLAVFTFLAWLLNREYWKDVH